MLVKLLHTTGEGKFVETEWTKPNIQSDEIEVKALMTGVCRSDIDMMNGDFALLPTDMHGHEGLGEVIAVGNNIEDCKVGDYVATRGEPGYADVYNCKQGTYCVVPEATPEYIIEPVACAVNMELVCREELQQRNGGKMLIIGTGFLAKVFHQTIQGMDYDFDIEVVGKSSPEYWGDSLSKGTDNYDVIVNLKDTDQVCRAKTNPNALIIMGTVPDPDGVNSNADWLWNNVTIKMPSPRAETFHEAMKWATYAIQTGKIEVDNVWTNSYSRETTWQQAFEHGNDRPQGYGRGYIEWD